MATSTSSVAAKVAHGNVQTTSDRHMTSYCGIDLFGAGGMSSLYMALGSVRIALPIRRILAHEEFAYVVSRRARVRCTDSECASIFIWFFEFICFFFLVEMLIFAWPSKRAHFFERESIQSSFSQLQVVTC
jgi:hypothetical protein